MKEEYKYSPLGEIPLSWEVVRLDEIGELKNGINKSGEDFGYGYPFINLMDVFGRNVVNTQNLSLVNATKNELKEFSLLKGDVLFVRSSVKPSGVGLTSLVQNNILNTVYSGFLIRFRDNGILNTDYKKYCFYESGFRVRLINKSTVSANTNINQVALKALLIVVPPLPEQRKIADILSTVDEKIEVINDQIENTRQLKKGLMQRLLTRGIGHTRFKPSPLGEIPENWEVVKIEQIADVKGGKRLPKGESLIEEPTPYPYIRVSDMYMGGINLANILYVPEHIQSAISRYTISKEDLFISVAGTLGIIGMIPIELDGANLTENADKLTKIKCSKDFLFQVLISDIIQSAIISDKTTNAQPKLALTRIQKFKIPLPDESEQHKIADILSSVDDKIDSLIDRRKEYERLKKGLMQKLLTGKIRVKLN